MNKETGYFKHLMDRDYKAIGMEEEDSEESDYPGSTPPRNRGNSPRPRTSFDETMNGARSTKYKVAGELREFFTIGELAKLLHRKAVTIRKWENDGWIPHANYRTPAPKGTSMLGTEPKGRRLYSREQVEFLLIAAEVYSLNNQREADWDGFKKHTATQWPV